MSRGYHKVMTTREEAHRLLDAVPAERLDTVVQDLRRWADELPERPVVREFELDGMFEAEPDLAARAKDILRERGGEGHGTE